jgi:hypothetical protein
VHTHRPVGAALQGKGHAVGLERSVEQLHGNEDGSVRTLRSQQVAC